MRSPLTILAGDRARDIIRDEGIRPERVRIISGAAGGPKWLVLAALDRLIFGHWLRPTRDPIHLIGSSIGSWRFAALLQQDGEARHRALEHAYIHQCYQGIPTPAEVTARCTGIVDAALPDSNVEALLTQSQFALHIATARGRHLLNRQADRLFYGGAAAAVVSNAVHRNLLGLHFRRTYFHHAGMPPPFRAVAGFSAEAVPLTPRNTKAALLASGSIPTVLAGVGPIPDAPRGLYWDGGVVDYHLDLPYDVDEDELILYPHFSSRITPGWFDKFLPWRRSTPAWMRNVVLVAPSPGFVSSLPLGRIPDRDDFKRFFGRDAERIAAWEATVEQCGVLDEAFLAAAAGAPDQVGELV